MTATNMNLALVMLSARRVQRFNNQYGIARVESCGQWDRGRAVMFQYCGDCGLSVYRCMRPPGRPHSRAGYSIRVTSPHFVSRYQSCHAGSVSDQASTPSTLAAVAQRELVAEGVFPEPVIAISSGTPDLRSTSSFSVSQITLWIASSWRCHGLPARV